MKQAQYAVKTWEWWQVTVEEFSPEDRDLRSRKRTLKHLMTTLCNSYEEAMEFLREIKLRQYPNIDQAWYAGKVYG